MKTSLPNYKELNQALNKTALKLHPSQVHGVIAGILCGDPKKDPAWEELVTRGESANSHGILQELYETSSKELEEFLFEFQLILPADSTELPKRAEALTLWCQGFLAGLNFAQVPIEGRSPSDMTEAINDLIEIAKMNYEDVISSEEDEVAYTELVEYVRMAVILIYQDIREPNAPKKTSRSSNNLH